MNFKTLEKKHHSQISEFFTGVFTSSENEEEGKNIGNLTSELALAIDNDNIFCFAAEIEDSIIGVLFFSRLFTKDAINIFMLAPMAVDTEHQGKGMGQSLITYALNEMRSRSVDVAITYGDPAFYSKVGFMPLSEDKIRAPLDLTQPEGWLGQSLTGGQIPTIAERPTCVKEFNNPIYW